MVGARRIAIGVVAIAAAAWGLLATSQAPPPRAFPTTFADRIAALSGPGGFFDTDNLISNERSYLHVVPALAAGPAPGGAYIGVGPDQNFSYIAHVRPALALIVDIRRDNLLLHLLFKALFAHARSRAEYLTQLTGRVPIDDGSALDDIVDLVRAVDVRPRLDEAGVAALQAGLDVTIAGFGVDLSQGDRMTMRRFHQAFIDEGLSLRFNSMGREPQWDYPSYRDLLLETDRRGVRRSFLASDELFRVVRDLQAADRVIPVVGDLSGEVALANVAAFLRSEGVAVSAFYASNVEFYLFRQRRFGRFIDNLARLPLAPRAILVRSAFQGGRPEPGYNSASLTQPIDELIAAYQAGRITLYWDLLSVSR